MAAMNEAGAIEMPPVPGSALATDAELAADAATAVATAPLDTAPFGTAPCDTAPFATAPFDTFPLDTTAPNPLRAGVADDSATTAAGA